MFSSRVEHGEALAVLARMPDASVDAVVTDPPYGLSKEPDVVEVMSHWLAGDDYVHTGGGFMGQTWDSFVPGPSVWREAFRVLKPGGHVLAFSSTRTEDLLGIALRMAGFERRDTIHYLFYSGFPKSLDVAKAIDRSSNALALWDDVRAHLRHWKDAAGLSNREVNEAVGSSTKGGGMAGHWFGDNTQPELPSKAQWQALKAALEWPDCDLDAVYDEVKDGAERPVVGTKKMAVRPHVPGGSHDTHVRELTTEATDDARAHKGEGTALKPAIEPILCYRKPLEGTVAENVLKWGTGALQIDRCRYRRGDPAWPGPYSSEAPEVHHNTEAGRDNTTVTTFRSFKVRPKAPKSDPGERAGIVGSGFGFNGNEREEYQRAQAESFERMNALGWYPANVYHCPKPPRWEKEAGCEALPGRTGAEAVDRTEGSAGLRSPRAGAGRTARVVRNHHPTVKPMGLMRWLVRLATPPGGVVVDMFAGSGTTGCAAACEGLRYVLIEREEDYLNVLRARLAYWSRRREETAPWASVPSRRKR